MILAKNMIKVNLYIDEFVEHLWVEHGLSNNTLSAYRSDIRSLNGYLKEIKLDCLRAHESNLIDYMSAAAGASPRSRSRRLSSIRRYYRYLLREKLISIDPSVNLLRPRLGRSLPKTLSEEDVELLLLAPNTSSALGVRDKAMLETLYATGVRVSELISIEFSNINLQQGVIRVVGKGDKERIVPLGEEAIQWLQKYLQEYRAVLLGNKTSRAIFLSRLGESMSRQSFWHAIKKYARQSGVKHSISPHTLRHCFATHLVNNNADLRVVQTLLGHSSISTTQIYTYVASERLKKLHQNHHPRG